MLGPPQQAHPGAVARAARRGRPDPAGHRAAGPRVRLAGAPVLPALRGRGQKVKFTGLTQTLGQL